MPIKRGPNGTYRKYSSRNGRYVKMTSEEIASLFLNEKKKKPKLSKKELQAWRNELFLKRAYDKNDPLVPETLKAIMKEFPNTVVDVNRNIITKDGSPSEADIITKKYLIEVKSGHRGKWQSQFETQRKYANEHGIKHIVLAPEVRFNTKMEHEKHGFKICTSIEELIKEMKK